MTTVAKTRSSQQTGPRLWTPRPKAGFRLLAVLLLVSALPLGCDDAPSRPTDDLSLRPVPDGGPVDTLPSTDLDARSANDKGSADAAPRSPARYPTNRTQSPITPYVAVQLKKIASAATRNERAFAKIGNSITVSKNFMHCFAGANIRLDGRALQKTIDHFKVDLGDGATSFDRTSLSATVGWAASKALAGTPSPLAQEIKAISPRFALVMYGSNDIGYKNIFAYANNMLEIADRLIGEGVIPILSSIPPRDDSVNANAEVPRYNAVVRGLAQGLQIPFIDFHRELLPLPSHGLSGDKLHPNVYVASGAKPCHFTKAALDHGYNLRNLLSITALDRLKQVIVDKRPAPDLPGRPLVGDGSLSAPIVIDALPFTDLRNTAASPTRRLSRYRGCNAAQDESGSEYLYRLELKKRTTIRALVFDRGAVDIDVHLLDRSASEQGCIARDDRQIVKTLAAGRYHFALDTFVKSGKAQAGEYLLVVLEE